jgi:LacI family transcriptional regulator
MEKRPTLADVAREAGVSKTTASLALNGKGLNKIPDETRARVRAAAEALRFRPHGVARALVRRRAETLGVVCTVHPFVELAHHAFEHALLSAIFHDALQRGYNPMIYAPPGDGAGEVDLRRYADGRSDAFVLLYPPAADGLPDYLEALGIPAVALCARRPCANWRQVDSDNEAGIRAALGHLVALGHRRIAYLIGPGGEDHVDTRVQAFFAVLHERGLAVRQEWIQPFCNGAADTYAMVERLFAGAETPTALLTWNDFAAEEVYKALRRLGRRIPEDVSIIGFDDMPSSRVAVPPLTTVRQDVVRLGRAAVDLALQALSADAVNPAARVVVCPVELVLRQSTAPCRVTDCR